MIIIGHSSSLLVVESFVYRLADQDEPVGVEENYSSLFYLLTAGSESSCSGEKN